MTDSDYILDVIQHTRLTECDIYTLALYGAEHLAAVYARSAGGGVRQHIHTARTAAADKLCAHIITLRRMRDQT